MRVLSFVLAVLLAACGGGIEEGPPEGWEVSGARWWAADVDTSVAFRSLETLESMEVAAPGMRYAGGRRASESPEVLSDRLGRGVPGFLLPLYRTHPAVVDSLFRRHVLPDLRSAALEIPAEEADEVMGRDAYILLTTYHFREPRPALELGADVSIRYPDSLRSAGIGGSVRMQVYLSAEGDPLGIMLVEGVHPDLDRESMRGASRMQWEPVKVAAGDEWRAAPGWTRYVLRFAADSPA